LLLLQIKEKLHMGYLWFYLSEEKDVVVKYSNTRSRDNPTEFFDEYSKLVQADGYTGYDYLFDTTDATRAGCWAHVRRKFFDLKLTNPKERKLMIELINKLYHEDRKLRKQDPKLREEEFQKKRKEGSEPILKKIRSTLEDWNLKSIPKSPLSKAVGYALNQWKELTVFLEYGFAELDNNAVERVIRSLAIGRKNWLFAGSEGGAHRAAIFYSLINTCKLNKINPFAYLKDILPKLSQATPEEIKKLTPRAWKEDRSS